MLNTSSRRATKAHAVFKIICMFFANCVSNFHIGRETTCITCKRVGQTCKHVTASIEKTWQIITLCLCMTFIKAEHPQSEQISEMYSCLLRPQSHVSLLVIHNWPKCFRTKKQRKFRLCITRPTTWPHIWSLSIISTTKESTHFPTRIDLDQIAHLSTPINNIWGKKYKRDSHTVQFQTLLHYRKAAPIPRGPYTISEARDVAPMLWYPHCSPIMEYEAPSNLVCLISVPLYPPHLQYHQKLKHAF
jgi:hypothetical protein